MNTTHADRLPEPTAPALPALPPPPPHPIQGQCDVFELHGEPEQQQAMFDALAEIQERFSDIVSTKKGQAGRGQFDYADLPAIMRAARPLLASKGLFLFQAFVSSPLGARYQRLVTMVTGHGARYSTALDFAPDVWLKEGGSGAYGQRLGSAWAYLRRMQLQAALMISPDPFDGTEGKARNAPPTTMPADPPATKQAPPRKARNAPSAESRVPPPMPEPEPEEESPPEPTPTVDAPPELMTKRQKGTLKDLFSRTEMRTTAEISDYIAKLLGEEWTPLNLTPSAADKVVSSLKLALGTHPEQR